MGRLFIFGQILKMKAKFFVVLLSLLVFISCKEEEEPQANAGTEFKVDGQDYGMREGFILSYGGDSNLVNLDVILLSEGLQIFYDGGYPDSVSGTGFMLALENWTSDSTALDAGTYNLASNPALFGITHSDLAYVQNGEFLWSIPSSEMSFELSREGATYDLAGNGSTINGKSVSFAFDGPLPIYY